MKIQIVNNKRYEKINLESQNVFEGYYDNYHISDELLKRLSRDLGFSLELYKNLRSINPSAASALVSSMSTMSKHSEVIFLLDDELKVVVDYTLDTERTPLLNSDFIHRVYSLVETSNAIELSEVYYHKDDKTASVIIKKKDPLVIEEKYKDSDSVIIKYEIGVLVVNDESSTTYSRLVLYRDNQPLYLPASYYNVTASRYKRSTSSSAEALEVLVLKIIDDLREESMYSKLYDFHFRYRANKNILASYEEYNTILRTMRKIPSIIEDNSSLEVLLSKYEEYEKKYAGLEDQKSSYLWRCTAFGDITINSLISMTTKILNDISAPAVEYFAIRELLGTYISTNRIAEEIAKESIN